MIELIDRKLLDRVSATAKESPRQRKNYNFHRSETEKCHRLLNAMEPESYIAPHCHLDPAKDEMLIALCGRLGLVYFNGTGAVAGRTILSPGGDTCGVNVPHGTYHTLVSLEPGSVFFEAKAGPYLALTADEKPGWAPAEGDPAAAEYLAKLRRLFVE